MITKELKIAAKELNEILSNMVSEEYILMIPKKFRVFLKEIEDKDYVCTIDFNKNIDVISADINKSINIFEQQIKPDNIPAKRNV